jgi:hypothetical protein
VPESQQDGGDQEPDGTRSDRPYNRVLGDRRKPPDDTADDRSQSQATEHPTERDASQKEPPGKGCAHGPQDGSNAAGKQEQAG